MDWTITVLRSARGEALFDDMVRRGLVETQQRDRVPVPPGRSREYVRPADWPAVPADPGA